MAKLSIHLIVYSKNESKYIPYLFESLKKQTFQDWQMIVIDNKSDGDVLSVVERELKALEKPYEILKQEENLGFASGHNVAYNHAQTEYVLLLNPDMYLMPDTLERMVDFLDRHKQASAVSTRLMRWDFDLVQNAASDASLSVQAEKGYTSQIDAIGIRLLRNRRAIEWLTGQTWAKDSESVEVRSIFEKKMVEVFGISGAFPMLRKSLIDQVLLPGYFVFDPTYHSYKEDLDLAYRMRNAGFTSYVLLDTVAYHDRTSAGPKTLGDFAAHKNKARQSEYVRFHSYKNHIRTLIKNEYWQNFLIDSPFILWFEIRKFGYLLLTNPTILLKGWKEIFANFSQLRTSMKAIRASRKMYWKGIRRWF